MPTPLVFSSRIDVFLSTLDPDHAMALWKVKEEFPSVPALVATPEIHQELVNLMFIFGKYLNMSSPGNPQSTLPDDSKVRLPALRFPDLGIVQLLCWHSSAENRSAAMEGAKKNFPSRFFFFFFLSG